ncbi:MAG: AMP-binding protein [Flavobacteriales bacterium]|nr:AMP-binding protein [Flavobacteriales bacterium]
MIDRNFRTLTVEGERLHEDGILGWCDQLVQRFDHAPWTLHVQAVLKELVAADGPLALRTSGTTGIPKEIRVPREDLIASARLTGDSFSLKAGDRVLHCLPSYYVAGKMMWVRAMVLGLDVEVVPPTARAALLRKTDRAIRFSAMIPLQVSTALKERGSAALDGIDILLLGGGPISKDLVCSMQQIATRCFAGYGSTETLTHVALRQLNGGDQASLEPVYQALGKVSFTTDEHDRLIIDTPHLSTMRHRTNDVVELIDEHRFIWRGRYDHVILSGGRKFHAEQLEEAVLGLMPWPIFFIGTPDAELGQCVTLVCEGERPGDEELAKHLDRMRRKLDRHAFPRLVIFRERFIRTATGKIERARTLRSTDQP